MSALVPKSRRGGLVRGELGAEADGDHATRSTAAQIADPEPILKGLAAVRVLTKILGYPKSSELDLSVRKSPEVGDGIR